MKNNIEKLSNEELINKISDFALELSDYNVKDSQTLEFLLDSCCEEFSNRVDFSLPKYADSLTKANIIRRMYL